jgi:hypothetical protein
MHIGRLIYTNCARLFSNDGAQSAHIIPRVRCNGAVQRIDERLEIWLAIVIHVRFEKIAHLVNDFAKFFLHSPRLRGRLAAGGAEMVADKPRGANLGYWLIPT